MINLAVSGDYFIVTTHPLSLIMKKEKKKPSFYSGSGYQERTEYWVCQHKVIT